MSPETAPTAEPTCASPVQNHAEKLWPLLLQRIRKRCCLVLPVTSRVSAQALCESWCTSGRILHSHREPSASIYGWVFRQNGNESPACQWSRIRTRQRMEVRKNFHVH